MCSSARPLKPEELKDHFSPYDLKRLHSYAQSMIDFHAIMDLLPLGEVTACSTS